MLKARVFTAIALFVIFLPVFFLLPKSYVYIVLSFVISLAAWEWARLIWPNNPSRPVGYAVFVQVILLFSYLALQRIIFDSLSMSDAVFYFLQAMLLGSVFFWVVCAPYLLKIGLLIQIDRYTFFLGVVGIFVFVSAWYACILLRNTDLWLFMSILIVVWSADIGAYFVGKKWGKTKLAALISPGKSWEGVFGGLGCVLMVFCIVKGFGLLDHFETHFQLKFFFSVIFLMGMSVVGDLFESLLKRLAGQKDSSQLLPGHGGVLDRLDALLPTLPIAAVLLQLLR